MPNRLPPPAYAGTPATSVLSAGTVLFRVHNKLFGASAFNPLLSHRYYGGGRFDPTDDDPYPYLYAADTVDTAVAETLLRDLDFDATGIRQLPRSSFAGRRISAIRTTIDLDLVTLRTGADLGAVAQDSWLTTCPPPQYPQSRHWAHWIRGHAPGAAGYVWLSLREPGTSSYVVFEDRAPTGAVVYTSDPAVPSGDRADFDTPAGRRDLRNRLSRYGVSIARR